MFAADKEKRRVCEQARRFLSLSQPIRLDHGPTVTVNERWTLL